MIYRSQVWAFSLSPIIYNVSYLRTFKKAMDRTCFVGACLFPNTFPILESDLRNAQLEDSGRQKASDLNLIKIQVIGSMLRQ